MKRHAPVFVALVAAFAGGVAAQVFLVPRSPVAAQPAPPPTLPDRPPSLDPLPGSAPLPGSVPQFDGVVAKVMPSVVSVDAVKQTSTKGKPAEDSGSGVLMRFEGFRGVYAVTNNHVVEGARPTDILVTLNDGRILNPERVLVDPPSDVAVLVLKADDLPAADLGDSDQLRPGHWVLAFGSPLGFNQTVTHGIISAKDRGQVSLNNTIRIKEFLQSDAAINPGSSGGPLADASGRIVGINTAIANGGSTTNTFAGISFSIPINLVKRVGKELLEKGVVTRGYLGMQMAPMLDAQTAVKLGLTRLRGAAVESTHANGPAARAGIVAGDVIQKVGGVEVRDENHFINIVGALPPGEQIRLTVWRNRQARVIDLTVADWPTGRR
ncbi:MAG: trypsin-like peptidase domain-containing protein [Fimbriiglobus sp.]|jgi:S1-C subfamily serine protease|nr:trypsin-like peptidase domain-containing protein [Fimbriiglobus sp.]